MITRASHSLGASSSPVVGHEHQAPPALLARSLVGLPARREGHGAAPVLVPACKAQLRVSALLSPAAQVLLKPTDPVRLVKVKMLKKWGQMLYCPA